MAQPHSERRGLCTRLLCADPATVPAPRWPGLRPPRPHRRPTLLACQPIPARRD